MTKENCTVYAAESNNTNYPFLVVSNSNRLHIAEDADDYDAKPSTADSLSLELKRAELCALRTTASAQIGRLYRLTNLILQFEPMDRSADELKQIAYDVRSAASMLEDTLHAIVGPMVDDPEPSEEEIAE